MEKKGENNESPALLGKRQRSEAKPQPHSEQAITKSYEEEKKDSSQGDKESPIYTFKRGLRFVKEYTYEYTTFAKRRWINRSLYEVYTKEFKAFTKQYYEDAIRSGMINVNGKKVHPDYKIKDGDKIIHKNLRKETPVLDTPIEIVYQDETLVAVDKPASVPVHPCGNFKYNSVLLILEIEHDISGLKSVHRLDRQTSGIVFFSKNDVAANEFRQALLSSDVQKYYYARVIGNFKESHGEQVTVDKWMYCVSNKDTLHSCDQYDKLTPAQKKIAKHSKTHFKFKFYDSKSNTSVVKYIF